MRISDWSSDVCSSDLLVPQARQIVEVALDLRRGALEARGADDAAHGGGQVHLRDDRLEPLAVGGVRNLARNPAAMAGVGHQHAITARQRQIGRSEEHTSELQSLMRISYAVFCLKKKKKTKNNVKTTIKTDTSNKTRTDSNNIMETER